MTTEPGKAAEAMIQQGYDELQGGDFESAIEAFSAALLVSPDNPAAFRGRGMAHFQLRHWDAAREDFAKGHSLNPHDEETWFGYALSLAMKLDIYPAIRELEGIIAVHPTLVKAYIHLGVLHFKLVAVAKGREYMQKALSLRPTLEQRRQIESILKEQNQLDKNRYYRPDFDALRKQKGA